VRGDGKSVLEQHLIEELRHEVYIAQLERISVIFDSAC